ncbi:MAG: tetratricopeptide repeat protein, partial [Candidatus Omnitrophica bacterium]|nr:tetratricopeptide repeat protein [Candidatus Omnitrophota bacterium]
DGKLDEARKVGEEVSKVFLPRAEFYYNLGYAYLLKGMVQEAKGNFERSIRINPDFIFSYNNLGCALWMATAYAQAIQRFQEAIGIDQTFVTAHFNLGVVYFDLKRLEEAYKEFETVLQLNPDYHEAREYLKLITETLHYQP